MVVHGDNDDELTRLKELKVMESESQAADEMNHV